MNAKMKATIAVAVVAMMVFAAAGATTYSWFSETEETDVTINTGKIVIDGQFQIGGLTVNGNSNFDGLSAAPNATFSNTSITVINAIDKLNIPVTYTLTNTSSVDAFWRFYTSLPDGWAINNVVVGGGVTATGLQTGLVYLAGAEDSGMHLDPISENNPSSTVVVTFNIVANDPEQITKYEFKFVSEAYQFGYNYSAPASLSAGKVTLGAVAGKDVKVEGLTSPVAGVNPIPVVMEFEASTGNTIAGKTLSITNSVQTNDSTFVLGSDNSAVALDIDLSDPVEVDGIVPLNGYVTITVPIPGNVPEPTVVFTGNPDEKIAVVDVEYVGNDSGEGVTYVTFKTNHFSKYVIGDFEAKVGRVYYESLIEAFNMSNGEIDLLKDVTLESTVVVDSGKVFMLNLCGNSIQRVHANNDGDAALSVAGELDIVGPGKITLRNDVNEEKRGESFASSVILVKKGDVSLSSGVEVINEGNPEYGATAGVMYGQQAIRNFSGNLTIDNSKVHSEYYAAVEVYPDKDDKEAKVAIKNNSEISGYRGIWYHIQSAAASVELSDCTVSGKDYAININRFGGNDANNDEIGKLVIGDNVRISNNSSNATLILWNEVNEDFTVDISYEGSIVSDLSVLNNILYNAGDGKEYLVRCDNNVGKLTVGTCPYVCNSADLTDAIGSQIGYVGLSKDVSLSDILVINKLVVFDGNGHKLTSTAGRAINISGADGVTIRNLTVECSGERAINVIESATNVTIKDCNLTSANYAVNVALSAPEAKVDITGCTITGLNAVNIASPGAEITIDNSTVNCNDNNTTEGESYAALCLNKDATGGSIIATNTTVNVTEGSDSEKGRNGASGGIVLINDSTEDVVVMVAAITYPDSDYYYSFSTLAEAIEFAEDGDTISLIRAIDVTDTLVIEKGKSVTIDLHGNDIRMVKPCEKTSCAISNLGELTLKDSVGDGEIYFKDSDETPGDPSFGYGTNTITNSGKLTIDGVTIINDTNGGSSNAVDNAPGSTLIVNSGDISSHKVTIRVRSASNVTINGGEITGSRAVQIHIFENSNATTLTIKGGTLNGGAENLALYSYAYGNCTFAKTTVNITGGTFNGDVAFGGGNKTEKENVNITGGTFNGDLGRYLANNGWEDIVITSVNE